MADSGFSSPEKEIRSPRTEREASGFSGVVYKWSGPIAALVVIFGGLAAGAGCAVTYFVADDLAAVEQSLNERIDDVAEGINSAERELDGRLDEVAERLSRVEGLLASIRDSLNRNAATRSAEDSRVEDMPEAQAP